MATRLQPRAQRARNLEHFRNGFPITNRLENGRMVDSERWIRLNGRGDPLGASSRALQ